MAPSSHFSGGKKMTDLDKALAYPTSREEIIPHIKRGLLYDLKFIHLDLIQEGPDRQRKSYPQPELDDLANSIERQGLIQPIVVESQEDGSYLLIAGARRLRAIKLIVSRRRVWPTYPTVPCVLAASLPQHIRKSLELEENIKRQDLHWKDEAEAILAYSELRLDEDPDLTMAKLAVGLGLGERQLLRCLRVARAIREGNPVVVNSINLSAADNAVSRSMSRASTIELSKFESTGRQAGPPLTHSQVRPAAQLDLHDLDLQAGPVLETPSGVLQADFTHWASEYRGEPFSLIHCDFPYGVGMHESDQASQGSKAFYKDDEAIYYQLVDCLIKNAPRLMLPNAHIMLWFSMSNYTQTLGKFKSAGFTVNPMPLIWFKSNKMGILPDPQRGPRQVYESALLISRGDPKIIRAVANCHPYPSPGRAARHPSEKPFEMLAYFFTMLVDSTTSLLDPTCGCGGALAAAIGRGARRVLGLEIDPHHVEVAKAYILLASKNPQLIPPIEAEVAPDEMIAAMRDATRDMKASDYPELEDELEEDLISLEDLGELDLVKLGLDDG